MRNLIILILLFFPCYAFANKAVIRSGEHANFSRITIQLSQSTSWSVGKVTHGYELRLEQSLTDIDLSKVYKRISRERISDLLISKDKKRITLKTNCDCFVDAFEFRPGFLVIDIKDGKAAEGSVFENTFAPDETLLMVHQYNKPTGPNRIAPKPETGQIVKLPTAASKSNFDNPSQARLSVGLVHSDINLPHIATPPKARLNQMQRIVLKQVSRAASQGLLQANMPFPLPADQQSHTEQSHVVEAPVATSNHQISPDNHINMHIQSSVDRAIEKSNLQHSLIEHGGDCLENRIFDISSWGNPASIFSEISKQTALAAGEFDKVNEQAVEDLVKAYLYAGFGAEAENALISFGIAIKHSNILKVMAKIVDGNPQSNNVNPFKKQVGCDADVELWTILAQDNIPEIAKFNTNSVLMAFAKLPTHLRLHLGPSLSQKFLDFGDIETAQALRDSISRTSKHEQPAVLLLGAQLDRERGHENSATHTFRQIIAEDGEISPIALIELLKTQLKHNATTDSYLLSTAETYIFERQGTKIGADLLHVLILSTAKSGNLTKTLELLIEVHHSTNFGSQQKNSLWEGVLEFALIQDTDEELIPFIISAENIISERQLSREVHRRLAKRLLKIGLPKLARTMLNPPNSPTLKDRLILAEIALSTHAPTQGIAILEGLTANEAIALRARAFSLNNNHFKAALEYDKLSDVNRAQREIWRAGVWEKLNTDTSEENKTAIEIMATIEPKPDSAQSHTISNDKVLVDNSKAMRANLEKLMGKYSLPTPNGT